MRPHHAVVSGSTAGSMFSSSPRLVLVCRDLIAAAATTPPAATRPTPAAMAGPVPPQKSGPCWLVVWSTRPGTADRQRQIGVTVARLVDRRVDRRRDRSGRRRASGWATTTGADATVTCSGRTVGVSTGGGGTRGGQVP
jgi:hypothetical protein